MVLRLITVADLDHISWIEFNELLRVEKNEQLLLDLLNAEKKGKRRRGTLLRLHARHNRLRGQRERQELAELARVR